MRIFIKIISNCSHERKRRVLKRNPLKNNRTMHKLNPFATAQKRLALRKALGLAKVSSRF